MRDRGTVSVSAPWRAARPPRGAKGRRFYLNVCLCPSARTSSIHALPGARLGVSPRPSPLTASRRHHPPPPAPPPRRAAPRACVRACAYLVRAVSAEPPDGRLCACQPLLEGHLRRLRHLQRRVAQRLLLVPILLLVVRVRHERRGRSAEGRGAQRRVRVQRVRRRAGLGRAPALLRGDVCGQRPRGALCRLHRPPRPSPPGRRGRR